MGFLTQLGKTVANAAKEEIRGGIVSGFLKGTGRNSANGMVNYNDYEYDANGRIKGINKSAVQEISAKYGGDDGNGYYSSGSGLVNVESRKNLSPNTVNTFGTTLIPNEKSSKNKYSQLTGDNTFGKSTEKKFVPPEWDKPITQGGKLKEGTGKDVELGSKLQKINLNENLPALEDNFGNDTYKLKLPSWGYEDFINERAIWQKQIGSAFNDPAWFYFKLFFDFDTGHGLLGGLLNRDNFKNSTNTAAKYLYYCKDMYRDENTEKRITALYKFASILSYICSNAPWFFKGVKGMDKLSIPSIKEYSQERSIEIELAPDAIDMRLTTLMSLYKYACYDDYNHKEVIPENLRKFNMSIVVFQAPLRYLHTSFTTNKKVNAFGIDVNGLAGGLGGKLLNNVDKGKMNYKSINSQNYGDRMSFKIYTLYGCEFDMESFAQIIPGEMTNEQPFQMGNTSIKITYTHCVEHSMNEFYQIMYGSNGFFFNNYSNYQNSNDNKIPEAIQKQQERYQTLRDVLENAHSGGTVLGMFNKPTSYKQAVDATEAVMNGMFESNDLLGDLGTNYILGLLGSSQNTDAPQGNIYGDVGIGSAYFKDKLEMLKNGVHENTMPPYKYDPENNPIYERGRPANEYSAYDWYNKKNQLNNFTYDIGSYLKRGASKAGSDTNDNIRKLVQSGYSSLFTDNVKSGNTREPYNYQIENSKADESWRQPNPWSNEKKYNDK